MVQVLILVVVFLTVVVTVLTGCPKIPAIGAPARLHEEVVEQEFVVDFVLVEMIPKSAVEHEDVDEQEVIDV